jgi:hypothetical protein
MSNPNPQPPTRDWLDWIIDEWPKAIGYGVGIILAVWLIVGWLISFVVVMLCGDWSFEKQGQFGDTFGTVSSLFSGIAAVGGFFTTLLLVVTLREQRKQLSLQKEQLDLDRKRDDVQAFAEWDRSLSQLTLLYYGEKFTRIKSNGMWIARLISPEFNRSGELSFNLDIKTDGNSWVDLFRNYCNLARLAKSYSTKLRVNGYGDDQILFEFIELLPSFIGPVVTARSNLYAKIDMLPQSDIREKFLSFDELVAFIGVYALRFNAKPDTHSSQVPQDYFAGQWAIWSPIVIPFLEAVRQVRKDGQIPLDSMEEAIFRYHASWQERHPKPEANEANSTS